MSYSALSGHGFNLTGPLFKYHGLQLSFFYIRFICVSLDLYIFLVLFIGFFVFCLFVLSCSNMVILLYLSSSSSNSSNSLIIIVTTSSTIFTFLFIF